MNNLHQTKARLDFHEGLAEQRDQSRGFLLGRNRREQSNQEGDVEI